MPGEAFSKCHHHPPPLRRARHAAHRGAPQAIEANGGDPFRDYSLPEAILELRRGVGRLIRTKQDKGIVVILDPRILTKNYGQRLPACAAEARWRWCGVMEAR